MDDLQLSQDSLSSLIAQPEVEQPVTPEPPHATLPADTAQAVSKVQANRVEHASSHMTPPPSTQVPSSQRAKTRTPTPTVSHISTPPPTIELPSQSQHNRIGGFLNTMNAEQISGASLDELRTKVAELQSALQEAKMTAAHHKLQYQMLSQESAAAIERMVVEARMAQYENEVIHVAEQAKAAATPVQPSPFHEGMIPVQKDLYQRMCREIQQLTEERNYLADDQAQKEKTILRQDMEISSLSDKVMLMRERIRENREHVNRYRRTYSSSRMDNTSSSLYKDPLRSGVSSQEQPQPFAALLQASEMASQEAHRPTGSRKGHNRNVQSISSLPATPRHPHAQPPMYQTPMGREPIMKVPSTAPLPRTSNMRTPDGYSQHALPVTQVRGPPSEGTVSAHEADDSEAETEIIEQDEISESQASRQASQMLRSSQGQQAKRSSFEGQGMLEKDGGGLKQTRLFGQVRKRSNELEDDRLMKKARAGPAVGLGIAGVRD